jgi:hypothetical protein
MRAILFVFVAAVLAVTMHAQPIAADALQIDHVILGINDLNRGIEDFQRLTGVLPVAGGSHPGRGTHNALASLGSGRYLEILAPRPDAPPSEFVDGLRQLTTMTPVGWAVSTSDVDATVRALQQWGYDLSDREPGSRERTDGSKLEWVSFDITTPGLDETPFVISWSPASRHPSTDSPTGCTLEALTIELLAQSPSRQLLTRLNVGVQIKDGKQARPIVSLRCPKGVVSFGANGSGVRYFSSSART